MNTAFEDITFLTRSVHRIDTLQVLCQGPRHPQTLRDDTSGSGTTLRRNLEEFENREWVVRTGDQYELTSLGRAVSDGFTSAIERLSADLESPIEAVGFVARSPHRLELLSVLAERSLTRREVDEMIDASSATLRRMLRKYEARKWVTRTGSVYETTPRGALVAEEIQQLVDRLKTKRELHDISQWFPFGFDITDDMFDNAVLSPQNPDKPYQPNPRFAQLVESAESYRGLDVVSLKPANVERLFRNTAAGMKTEVIYPFTVLQDMLTTSPTLASRAIESDNFTMFGYEEPYEELSGGFALIDDRLVTCCRDYETGLPRTIVDTTVPDAVDWAMSMYESFRREARLIVDPASRFPSVPLQVGNDGSENEETTSNVVLPKRETCYEQLRLTRAGESTVCIYCDSENVIKKGKSGKGAQRYRCKDCDTFFNDLTNTVFEHHKFTIEEMFYVIKTMRSKSTTQIARDLGRDGESIQNFVEEVRTRDKQMLKQVDGTVDLSIIEEESYPCWKR